MSLLQPSCCKKIRLITSKAKKQSNLSNYILSNDTYFGIIMEYFPSIDYVQYLCLISKLHYNLIKQNNNNLRIMRRILTNEFFDYTKVISLNKLPLNTYSIIWFMHNIYKNDNYLSKNLNYLSQIFRNESQRLYVKLSFPMRWGLLLQTKDIIIKSYGIKYWFNSMANYLNIPIQYLGYKIENNSLNTIKYINLNKITDIVGTGTGTGNGIGRRDLNINSARHVCTIPLIIYHDIDTEYVYLNVFKILMDWFADNQWYSPFLNVDVIASFFIICIKQNDYYMISWFINHYCNYSEIKFKNHDNINNEIQKMETRQSIGFIILHLPTKHHHNKLFELRKCFEEFKQFNIVERMKRLWIVCAGNTRSLRQFLYPITLDDEYCDYWK